MYDLEVTGMRDRPITPSRCENAWLAGQLLFFIVKINEEVRLSLRQNEGNDPPTFSALEGRIVVLTEVPTVGKNRSSVWFVYRVSLRRK